MFYRSEKEIAVCGAFRTGTNYVKFLLEKNYHCRVVFHAYGWKHGFIPALSPQSRIPTQSYPGLFVTKDPLSHIVSLHRYFSEAGKNIAAPVDWDAFVTSPLSIFVEANRFSPEYRFSSPADYWNSLNWNFLSAASKREDFNHVRYESLIESPEIVISELAQQWDLRKRSEKFQVPGRKMKRMSDKEKKSSDFQTGDKFDENYYLTKGYRNYYSHSQIEFVASRIESSLLSGLGYGAIQAEVQHEPKT